MEKIIILSIDGILADIDHRFYHSISNCNCNFKRISNSHDDSLNSVVYEFYLFLEIEDI